MKNVIILILAFSTVLSACAKEMDNSGSDIQSGTVLVCTSSVESKVTMGPESAGKIAVLWETDDKIVAYDAMTGEKASDASLTEGAGTGTGRFLCDREIAPGTSLRVLYPSESSYSGKNGIPSEQTQAAAGSSSFATYSFAYSEIFTTGETSSSFTLNHVPAYLKVSVSGESFAGYKLNSLVFKCEGAVLSGSFTVDYTTGEIKTYADAADFVEVSLTTPLTVSATAQDVWLSVLPSDLGGKFVEVVLNMTDKSGNPLSQSLKFSGRNLVSNKVYTLKVGNPTLDWMQEADLSKEEYTTTDIQWKQNKSGSSYVTKQARTAMGMNHMDRVREGYSNKDVWGGSLGIKPDYIMSGNPDGFWRVGRWGGRSVMVDPLGNVAVLCGMNNVSPEPVSEASVSTSASLYNGKWSTDLAFAQQAGAWMEELGFNFYIASANRIKNYRGTTCKSDSKFHGMTEDVENAIEHPSEKWNVSAAENLYLLRTFYYDYYANTGKSAGKGAPMFCLLFDPDWLSYIDDMAAYAASIFKNNPNFVGYYLDNELPIFGTGTGAFTEYTLSLKNFLDCTEERLIKDGEPRFLEYANAWAKNWMQENYGTTEYSAAMEDAFVKAVCDYYFRTCCEAVRRNDPNHLVLGNRINQPNRGNEIYMRSCAEYCDVVSINYYAHSYEVGEDMTDYASWLGKTPYIITEMYVKGEDQNTANEGAGDFTKTQADRGWWYNNYCIALIEKGNCAGWMWFKFWNDYNSGGWVNKGILKNDMSGLSTDCTGKMAEFNRNSIQVLKYFSDTDAGSNDNYAGMLPSVSWVE